jgi:CDP-diacylglycerol--inositol 3-phosphatidyltransferase
MATSSPKLSRRSSAPKKRSAVAVLLYVPNLIGYVRIALAFVGYAYAFDSLQVTLGAYLLSQALDVADGFAARALGQSSKFGAVLDMVTDRTSTACLCLVLSRLYPQHVVGFAGLITLDLFSHWFQMYASLAAGGETHKASANFVVRLYYRKPVLFAACAGTEFWYLALYCLAFGPGPAVVPPLLAPLLPPGAGLYALVLYACAPIFAFKQFTNLVQLWSAATQVAAM